ncbi:MAG: hypothetical protein LBS42_11135 [Tannerella sp.]|jgi:uncharacterized protein (TIGR02145 family)|nr:hypothetical protein [Tannerella sp.]
MKKRDCIIFLIWCIVSCSIEDTEIVPVIETETSEIKISMIVPGAVHPSTYGISGTDENEIQTLDILAFSKNSSNVDTFCYRVTVEPSKIETALGGVDGNKKNVTAKLERSKTPVKLVLIANASSILDGVAPVSGETMAAVYSRLKFPYTGKWQTSPYKPFYIWGEADDYVPVQDPVVMERIDVVMVRSIAKIDVGVDLFASDPSIGFGTHFKIQHVYVYNTQNKGFIAPYPSSNFNTSTSRATAPSVPADASDITAGQVFTVPAASNKFFNEIYVTEANSDKMFLVIGATYDNGTEMFYRVDFRDSDGDPLAILRNFRYLINIRNILRPGYATAAEAAAARNANLEYDLSAVDVRLLNFVFDGQYYLALSESDLIIDGVDDGTKKIWVETDCPGTPGWSVTYSGALFSGSPVNDAVSTTFAYSAWHGPAYTREGTITFKAGTLTKTIRVRQYASFASGILTSTIAKLYYETANLDGVSRYIFSGNYSWKIVWEDRQGNTGLSTGNPNPTAADLMGDGNSVIAMVNSSNETLWTWHVWYVDGYNPNDPANQVNYKGNIFMDRNLGATTNDLGDFRSYGLMYQWGRKEPFPRANALTGNVRQTVYSGSPTVPISVQDVTALGSNPLEDSHRNPTVFITSTTPPYFTWSGTTESDNSLWTAGGLKSVYDPCPAGWRVPTSAEFLAALTPVGGWNYGQAYEGGLKLPAAGGTDFSTGGLFDVGTNGYYWTAETAGANAKILHIRNGSATIEEAFRANGFSVRCMKEKYE